MSSEVPRATTFRRLLLRFLCILAAKLSGPTKLNPSSGREEAQEAQKRAGRLAFFSVSTFCHDSPSPPPGAWANKRAGEFPALNTTQLRNFASVQATAGRTEADEGEADH